MPSACSRSSSASTRIYLRATEAVAHDNSVKTAYFLQPVPAWGKTLTEEEKRVVGDLSYGDLYRRIVAGMMTLRERGLPMYDLGDIFATRRARSTPTISTIRGTPPAKAPATG